MRRSGRLAGALAFTTVLVMSPVWASTSRTWTIRDRGDFESARLDGVALGSDGSVRLSAQVIQTYDAAQPYQWCLARAGDGTIYSGGGNEGKVFRIARGSESAKLVFDADQLEVHALALDSKDRLYVGTSPRGAVYRVEADGGAEVVFDPPETYIWAIAFDEKDRLHVATGHSGRVYRVDDPSPGATGRIVLDSRDEHVRTLSRSSRGGFFAGSGENGILYRIDASGKSAVVYDSPMNEMASIAILEDEDGREVIYAAILSPLGNTQAQDGSGAGNVTVRVTADDGDDDADQDEQQQQEDDQQQRPRRRQEETYHGAVFRITADGYGRQIWESREVLPLSLLAHGGDGVLVGTSDDGRVLFIEASGDEAEFTRVPASHVNALIADGEEIVAAASNLGMIARISPGASRKGTITSGVHDAGFISTWGSIAWTAELPAGSSIALQVRTGNTEDADGSWSDWSGDYIGGSGTPIDRPKARFLQWRAVLTGGRNDNSPVLHGVRIGYLQDNLPPVISGIDVLAPGVALSASGDRPENGGRRVPSQPRQANRKGERSVVWKAEDANGDEIRYDVYYKGEDEGLWKPMARDLVDQFWSWDETLMPDGIYRVRVTATDSPSNPPGESLTSSRTSIAFDVDNTPPYMTPPASKVTAGNAEVTVNVVDSFSPIGDVSYSLNASEWIPLLPEDKVADSTRESYRFRTQALDPGEYVVTIRASDRAGNTTAGKVVILVSEE